MTSARCPSCQAALAESAAWCTLCFADLRPAPAVEPEAAAVVAPELVPAASAPAASAPSHALAPHPVLDGPLTAPVEETRRGRHALDPEDLPVMSAADVAAGRPGWPCQTCHAVVSLETTNCPACGSSFLAGAEPKVGFKMPLIGDITALSTGARFALMAAGALVVTVVFFALLALLGSIF